MFLVITKVLLPSVVVLTGVLRFHYMNGALRLIFFQVFAYLVVLTLTKQLMIFQKANLLDKDTQVIYNFYLPIETILLIWTTFKLFKTKYLKSFSIISVILFLIVFLSELSIKSIYQYSTFSDSIANLFLLLLFSVLLYTEFQNKAFTWFSIPIIWVAIGVITFSASTFAYMSLFEYLNKLDATNNRAIFRVLFGVLSNIRYICIGLAFWFITSDHPKFSNDENT